MNLVPGATPPVFQNAQTDTPGRALSDQHQRHEPQQQRHPHRRRRQHQRVAAAPRRLHRAGRDDRERQHLDQQLRRRAGHDRRRRDGGGRPSRAPTTSGARRSSSATRTSSTPAAATSTRPSSTRASSIMGGTVGGPIRRNRCSTSASGSATSSATAASTRTRCRPRRCATATSARCSAFNPAFRIYDPATGNPRPARAATVFADAVIPANRISAIARHIQALYPAPNTAGTNNGLQNNYVRRRAARRPIRDNYDVKVNWNRTSAHQIWGKFSMMDASVQDLFYLPFDERRRRRHDGLPRGRSARPGRSARRCSSTATSASNKMNHAVAGPGLRHQLRHSTCSAFPALNSAGVDGPGLDRSRALQRHAGVQHRPVGARQQRRPGRRCGARSAATRPRSTSPRSPGRHEIRTGFDFVRLTLDHWQPEVGNPRGTLTFGGGITGTPGYAGVGGWNSYARSCSAR